jgi:hypothetical protein
MLRVIRGSRPVGRLAVAFTAAARPEMPDEIVMCVKFMCGRPLRCKGEVSCFGEAVGCSHVSGLCGAVRITAGPDGVRGSGPNQQRALTAQNLTRVVPILVRPVSPIASSSPSQSVDDRLVRRGCYVDTTAADR